MKGFIVFSLSLCLVFTVCLAEDELMKEAVRKFLKCVACAEPGSELRTEYHKCSELKPERLKATMKACCDETMPAGSDEDARWALVCADDGILTKVCDCVKAKLPMAEVTTAEMEQFSKYKECAKKLNEEKCK
uniref:U10-hexatoxin-Hi1a n=1 Tax=Hadronyche infensa TaxID=153481 RepID=TA1A_HADIN